MKIISPSCKPRRNIHYWRCNLNHYRPTRVVQGWNNIPEDNYINITFQKFRQAVNFYRKIEEFKVFILENEITDCNIEQFVKLL